MLENNRKEIIPAIIPESFDDLREKVSLVRDYVSHIQVDVTDGVFVSSKSWPLNDEMWNSGVCVDLPFCHDCRFELDLMVENADEYLDNWFCMAGVKRIVFHIESIKNTEVIFEKACSDGREVEIGFAFNIDTDLNQHEALIKKSNFVQLMGIDKIGVQGSAFDDKVIQKIVDLRKWMPDVTISVDGGVSLDNAERLLGAGANRLVSGSAIFESRDIEGVIKKFKTIFEKY